MQEQQKAEKQLIEEHEIIRLTPEDQHVFIQALLHSAKPNVALLKAMNRYKKEVEK